MSQPLRDTFLRRVFEVLVTCRLTANTNGTFTFAPSPTNTQNATPIGIDTSFLPNALVVNYVIDGAGIPDNRRLQFASLAPTGIGADITSPFFIVPPLPIVPTVPTQVSVIVALDGKLPASPTTVEVHIMVLRTGP